MIPNLLHPVPVKVRKIDSANTVYDDNHREPVQQSVRSAVVTTIGQVMWYGDENMAEIVTHVGVRLKASGYILFRFVDLAAVSLTIEYNDQFIQIGTIDTDVYVIKLVYRGHYPDVGGPTLVRAYFSDKQPKRQG